MHTQPLFEGAQYVGTGFDDWLFDNGLCLPSDSALSEENQDEVIQRIAAMLEQGPSGVERAEVTG